VTATEAAEPLAAVLRTTGPVLLDFDGPITELLPAGPNAALADAAREPMVRGGVAIPAGVAKTTDHLAVLRFAAKLPRPISQTVESICIAGEVEASRRSAPTAGAVDAIQAFRQAGRPVVVVSNNAAEAIDAYLRRQGVGQLVHGVVGRLHGRPELMKPHPESVQRALRILAADPSACVLIGDSVTDVQAARRAGVRSIGYAARTSGRGAALAEAGADAIVDDMATLANIVRLLA
jgi:phosphoglycolate phosphatase